MRPIAVTFLLAVLLVACEGSSSGSMREPPTSSSKATLDDVPENERDAQRIQELEQSVEALETRVAAAEEARDIAEGERDKAVQGGTQREKSEGCDRSPVRPSEGEAVVVVYQTCQGRMADRNRVLAGLDPVGRVVAADQDLRLAALEELVAGPTSQESSAGYSSFFSSATAEAVRSVTLTDHEAVIDLGAEAITGINNVSTATGGNYFRGQLYGTVFANAPVDTAEMRLDGDPALFCGLMELVADCTPRTRSQWNEIYVAVFEDAMGSLEAPQITATTTSALPSRRPRKRTLRVSRRNAPSEKHYSRQTVRPPRRHRQAPTLEAKT